jgi:alpha-1,3-glucosyltransferase
MNLTYNLPLNKWYDSRDILPKFFPIDYPPVSSYHQYLCGVFLALVEPDSMIIGKSNEYSSKTFYYSIRSTVLITELLVFVPSILFFFYTFYREKARNAKNIAILLLLTIPGIVIIDYQRFQYNNIVFGFSIFSIAFTMKGKFRISAAFLAFAVWYKVLAMYYSLSFAMYWTASIIKNIGEKDPNRVSKTLYELVCIGISGAIPCIIIWWPWLTVKEVWVLVRRFFDIRRLYIEDSIANFWSRLYLVIDLEIYFTKIQIAIICSIFTLAFSLPFLYLLAKNPRPKNFLYATSGVSLSFYLFSYMVHEKALLYSIVCLSLTTVFDDPNFFQFSIILSGFNLYQLESYDIYYTMQIIFYSISVYYIKYVCKLQLSKIFHAYYIGMLFLTMFVHLDYFMSLGKKFYFMEAVLSYVFIGIGYLYYLILANHIKLYRNPFCFEAAKKNE